MKGVSYYVNNRLKEQIYFGAVRNLVNGFLIERQNCGLLKRTLDFNNDELRHSCSYLDGIGPVDLEELTADVIPRYLHDIRENRNKGGVYAAYRVI